MEGWFGVYRLWEFDISQIETSPCCRCTVSNPHQGLVNILYRTEIFSIQLFITDPPPSFLRIARLPEHLFSFPASII